MSAYPTSEEKQDFIRRALAAADAARAGGAPIVPGIAAPQAALESRYGASRLAVRGNNLFGIKAGKSWQGLRLAMPTVEMQDGELVTIEAYWRSYPDWTECFADYGRLIGSKPWFADAAAAAQRGDALGFLDGLLAKWAPDGEVDEPGWSTNPQYRESVLAVAKKWGLA
jgi:flagellum-specific peptidoglycan hydrolase FlgJ